MAEFRYPPVEHTPEAQRFRMTFPTGVAELAYAPAGEGVLDFYSTFVPPPERGRGVAARLVRAGLAYARAEGYRVVPSCWYVRRWIDAHPEQADLVV